MSLSFAAVAALAGCLGAPDDPSSESEQLDATNGVSLNGVSLNGVSLNGVSLNGVSLNGVSLNGVSLNGQKLNGVSLNGTQLTGVNSGGQVLSGTGIVGSLFAGTLSNGAALTLRVESATTGVAPNADVWMYGVSYQTSTGWAPLCGLATTLVVPVSGSWSYAQGVVGGGSFTADPTKVTFGCRGTAIAKCVEWGYKPWKLLPTGTGTLQNHHVACTRMVRGDYCGDGSPGTVNGTPINLYDAVGIQTDTEGWDIDAEWGTAGARCVSEAKNTRFVLTGLRVPSCLKRLVTKTCGVKTDFGTQTLLINEFVQ